MTNLEYISYNKIHVTQSGEIKKVKPALGFFSGFLYPKVSAHLGTTKRQSREDFKSQLCSGLNGGIASVGNETGRQRTNVNILSSGKRKGCGNSVDKTNKQGATLMGGVGTNTGVSSEYPEPRYELTFIYFPNTSIHQSYTVPAMSTLTTGDLETLKWSDLTTLEYKIETSVGDHQSFNTAVEVLRGEESKCERLIAGGGWL